MSTNISYLEKRSRKYLNNPKYSKILWIIGKSKTPISRYQVMREYSISIKDVYIYEIIGNLAGRLYETKFLFNLTELFLEEKSIKLKIIEILKKMNQILDLNIEFLKKGNEDLLTPENIYTVFPSNEKEGKINEGEKETLIIGFGTTTNLYSLALNIPNIDRLNSMYIDTDLSVSKIFMESDEIERRRLEEENRKRFEVRLTLNKKKEILVKLLKNRSNITVNYLELTYDDNTINLLNKKKGEYPNLTIGGLRDAFPEVNRAVSNSENWRYLLNFRGLLLFLACISNSYNKIVKEEEILTKKKILNEQFKEVISNERIKELAPFLKYWDAFEKEGFPVIKLLIKIADELKDQLNYESTDLSSNNNDYLLKRVTERYFVAWLNYFYYRGISIKGLNEESIKESDSMKIFLEYKKNILNFLKVSYENDIKTIERLLNFH